MNHHPISSALRQAILAHAETIARKLRFVRRLRQLQPDTFTQTLSLYLMQHPHATLEQMAEQLDISAPALSQRFQQDTTSKFLLAMLNHALASLPNTTLPKQNIPILQRFNGVYLTDATIVRLPASLADRFQGYGGGKGKDDPRTAAAAKILLQMQLDPGTTHKLLLDSATKPDITLLRQLPTLPKGALHMADLGFFDTAYFKQLNVDGVYWLTRVVTRIQLKLPGQSWQELSAWLNDLDRSGLKQQDIECEVGKSDPVTMRLMVVRCPVEESARRRRQLHDRMRRKGKKPSQRQLVMCDWWVLGTNTSVEKLPLKAASALYRCRWQIELLFKRWKSLGQLMIDLDHSAKRAECELYGKLLGVILVNWLALSGGGVLSSRSSWRGWQIVLDLIPTIIRALSGRSGESLVWDELIDRLDHRPKKAKRKRRPNTRQTLYRTTLTA